MTFVLLPIHCQIHSYLCDPFSFLFRAKQRKVIVGSPLSGRFKLTFYMWVEIAQFVPFGDVIPQGLADGVNLGLSLVELSRDVCLFGQSVVKPSSGMLIRFRAVLDHFIRGLKVM